MKLSASCFSAVINLWFKNYGNYQFFLWRVFKLLKGTPLPTSYLYKEQLFYWSLESQSSSFNFKSVFKCRKFPSWIVSWNYGHSLFFEPQIYRSSMCVFGSPESQRVFVFICVCLGFISPLLHSFHCTSVSHICSPQMLLTQLTFFSFSQEIQWTQVCRSLARLFISAGSKE